MCGLSEFSLRFDPENTPRRKERMSVWCVCVCVCDVLMVGFEDFMAIRIHYL